MNIFATNSGVSYPILMFGGANGILTDYNCPYDYLFVIGGDGIILWRGNYDDAAIRAAIDDGLAALASPAPPAVLAGHRLLPGYPNPFNPVVRIPYELDGAGPVSVRLEVLDLRGRRVRTLVAGVESGEGIREAVWDGADEAGVRQPSGTYLVNLAAGGVTFQRTVALVK
ncbi:MAG: FlgD immunoglobulin-like domain containing protein [bacterium]